MAVSESVQVEFHECGKHGRVGRAQISRGDQNVLQTRAEQSKSFAVSGPVANVFQKHAASSSTVMDDEVEIAVRRVSEGRKIVARQ